MIIPSPSFSSFEIAFVSIKMYAICILLGVICGYFLGTSRAKKILNLEKGNNEYILNLVLICVPFSIICARIYHTLTYFSDYYFNPRVPWYEFIMINHGGLAIFGGIIGALISSFLVSRYYKISWLKTLDIAAPCLLLGQAIGRWGNYFNQELYGSLTGTQSFGLQISGHSELYHPTFLYESIWNLLGIFLILLIEHFYNNLKSGQIFSIYLIWYGFGRVIIENIRINESNYLFGLRINVWTAIIAVIIGIASFIYLSKSSSKDMI